MTDTQAAVDKLVKMRHTYDARRKARIEVEKIYYSVPGLQLY